MDQKKPSKFIINFIKNSFHKVDSFFSIDDVNVVFTEDSKCFPINEVGIFKLDTLTKCLKKTLRDEDIMSMMIDPNTEEQINWCVGI